MSPALTARSPQNLGALHATWLVPCHLPPPLQGWVRETGLSEEERQGASHPGGAGRTLGNLTASPSPGSKSGPSEELRE